MKYIFRAITGNYTVSVIYCILTSRVNFIISIHRLEEQCGVCVKQLIFDLHWPTRNDKVFPSSTFRIIIRAPGTVHTATLR